MSPVPPPCRPRSWPASPAPAEGRRPLRGRPAEGAWTPSTSPPAPREACPSLPPRHPGQSAAAPSLPVPALARRCHSASPRRPPGSLKYVVVRPYPGAQRTRSKAATPEPTFAPPTACAPGTARRSPVGSVPCPKLSLPHLWRLPPAHSRWSRPPHRPHGAPRRAPGRWSGYRRARTRHRTSRETGQRRTGRRYHGSCKQP
mmetsp:Transcript_35565/g.100145  ORF Transcript_35565/g.100145 Transcript_35565/m.100145 type:complete len:201 (-) Transcript_35565:583-1185(-)